MKKIIILSLMCFGVAAFAQKVSTVSPEWTLPIDGKTEAIFVSEFSGIPVVETNKFCFGIDYEKQEIIWKIKRKATVVSSVTLIPETPFACISDTLIDVTNGNVILENVYYVGQYLFPEINTVLLQVQTKETEQWHFVDMETKKIIWSKDIPKDGGFNLSFKTDNFKPSFIGKNIILKHKKMLYLVDSSNGNSIWESEGDPGNFFLDKNEKYMMTVEKGGGLFSSNEYGKKVTIINYNTGQKLFKKPIEIAGSFVKFIQLDDENVLIAGRDGFNIYKYETGEQLWKKDYEAKKLNDVTITDEGFEVLYADQKMIVDKTTGKATLAKPVKVDEIKTPTDQHEFENGIIRIFKKSFASYLDFVDKTTNQPFWKAYLNIILIEFNNANNSFLAKAYGTSTEDIGYYLVQADPNAKVDKRNINNLPPKLFLEFVIPKEITSIQARDNGYFLLGKTEYVFLDLLGMVVEQNYFKFPEKQFDAFDRNLLGGKQTEIAEQDKAIKRCTVRETKDFAYFLSGKPVDGETMMILIEIDKNSGQQSRVFNLGYNRYSIYEISQVTNKLFAIIDGQLAAFNL
ncbi:MAG: hypothetical protein LBT27_05045 [Prevotellaceae bacterium]|jgi:hypothetical protein|nr:hypothetical protein [Prevotellaceae bacterium]